MKTTVSTIIEEIKAGRRPKSKKRRRDNPRDVFHEYLDDAFWIAATTIHDKSKSSMNEKRLATSNLIVNHVTGIEAFFRNVVVHNKAWSGNGIEALMREKISISDAYSLIQKGNVRLEHVIAETFSFNELSQIGTVMKALTGCTKDFWVEVEEHEVDTLDAGHGLVTINFLDMHPDWRKETLEMYKERNRYVHEGVMTKRNSRSTVELHNLVKHLIDHSNDYLVQRWKIKS